MNKLLVNSILSIDILAEIFHVTLAIIENTDLGKEDTGGLLIIHTRLSAMKLITADGHGSESSEHCS